LMLVPGFRTQRASKRASLLPLPQAAPSPPPVFQVPPPSPLAPAPGARLQRRRSQRGSRSEQEEEEAASPPLGARPEPPRQVPRAARRRGLTARLPQ
jgi:hypothetical protein